MIKKGCIVLAVGARNTAPAPLSDEAAMKINAALLDVVGLALEQAWTPRPADLRVSISPVGVMIAYPDDNLAKLEALLSSLIRFAAKQQLPIAAAITSGRLQPILYNDFSANFEGRAAILAARLLAGTERSALALSLDTQGLWPRPAELTDLPITEIKGKRDEKFKCKVLANYFSTILVTKQEGPAILMPPRAHEGPWTPVEMKKKTRFLRRRCREVAEGSTEFLELVAELGRERAHEETAGPIWTRIRKLKHESEKALVGALVYEGFGQIELMLQETCRTFGDATDLPRCLLKAIALEKLDRIPEALSELYRLMLRVPADSPLLVAAQFNANVCLEKSGEFDSVDFERFIEMRDAKLCAGEWVWHKAISMELILCMRTARRFKYEEVIEDVLASEAATLPSGYVKTLINWTLYSRHELTDEIVVEVQQRLPSMSMNGRAAVLRELIEHFARRRQPELAESLRLALNGLVDQADESASVKKFAQ